MSGLIGVSLLVGTVLGVGILGFVTWQVFYGDASELQKTAIMTKINEETSLFYLDEKTRIGSIFESQHRRYVSIDEVPTALINAIVAAEDKNFYHHVGIDPASIFKAFAEGVVRGGRFRRGGSSITQQTVKNLMSDWEMSFSRKYREMIKSMQMERLYTKREILEFYLNQFHVAGNGHGAEIAARYYFNKDIKELNLVESAFIAGSVKGPGKYNPFIKYTKHDQERARLFANQRKNYVLEKMYEQGWVTKAEYKEAMDTPVPFDKGEFRTAEVSLVELIREQLEKAEVLEALGLKKPEDLNIAGYKVYTTIDAQLQKRAQTAVRKNLSRLDTALKGLSAENPSLYHPQRGLEVDSFVFGQIEAIEPLPNKEFQFRMNFGVPTGILPYESLVRYAKLLDLPTGKGTDFYLNELKTKLKVGDTLFVEVRSYNGTTHEAVVEMQKRPEISGGLIALDKGEVRAVISGFDTVGFNRAMYARRQPGSVVKPLVYFAALQLGWSVLDRLDNFRQIFPYQGTVYFPRPDHFSPFETTSMLWAGTKSENLASVSLGGRLLEKLSFTQFKTLMDMLDLSPTPGQLPRDFHFQVARKTGVSLDEEGVLTFQLENAKKDLMPDLVFSRDQRLQQRLKQMWWGNGYLEEARSLSRQRGHGMPAKEADIRLSLVGNNYLRLLKLRERAKNDWAVLQTSIAANGIEASFAAVHNKPLYHRFRVLGNPGKQPELGYFGNLEEEGDAITAAMETPTGRPLSLLDVYAIWGKDDSTGGHASHMSVGDVKISGYLDIELLNKLQHTIQEKLIAVKKGNDPYRLSWYYQHHDFRIALGLRYVVAMSRACGEYNPLDPVLSFPLGTSAVTTSEIAKVYQTFIDGKVYKFFEKGPDNQINFIRRIEDRHGHVLYEPKVREFQVVKPEITVQIREVLQKVVTHGTGRRAKGELYVDLGEPKEGINGAAALPTKPIRIPAFGKTGTTNDYLTSYYAGFIPYPTEKGKPLDVRNSLVIATYVGYDRNRIMQRGRLKVSGSAGALPAWVDFAKAFIEEKDYKSMIDPLDLTLLSRKEWPLMPPPKLAIPVIVDLPRGLILRVGSQQGEGESWSATNFSKTGEKFENPYAIEGSTNSLTYIPLDPRDGTKQPLRYFMPFERAKTEPIERTSTPDFGTEHVDEVRPPAAQGKEIILEDAEE